MTRSGTPPCTASRRISRRLPRGRRLARRLGASDCRCGCNVRACNLSHLQCGCAGTGGSAFVTARRRACYGSDGSYAQCWGKALVGFASRLAACLQLAFSLNRHRRRARVQQLRLLADAALSIAMPGWLCAQALDGCIGSDDACSGLLLRCPVDARSSARKTLACCTCKSFTARAFDCVAARDVQLSRCGRNVRASKSRATVSACCAHA